ncbi:MAG: sensor histidine kinase, partial [Terriglobales bacterium]
MFRSLRWRLTLWFVTLTACVYVLSAVFALYLFRQALNSIVDEEVRSSVSEIEPAIRVHSGHPSLHEWARTSLTIPFKFLPTIQLYDQDGKMVEHYGPHGVAQLYRGEVNEVTVGNSRSRIYSTPLAFQGRSIGFLQVAVNLRNRDRAVSTFVNTVTVVAPFLLLSLGLAGYFFSGFAARPIEEGFDVLRQFMSDAGHELGTPIAIIQANAEAMEPDMPQNETVTGRLAIIMRSTERLGSLVQDLILLSKMESPAVAQRKTALDLDKIVKAVMEDFDVLFTSKGIILTSDKIQACPIYGDQEWLKRLLMNLLQNAMRYTDKGGTVTVNLEQSGKMARLAITDTG